jgi:HSP20 family protein
MFVYALPRPAPVAARQFSRALDRFFDDATDRYFGGARPGSAARTPALDVSETDSHYTVALDVPGITREQLKVTIEGRRLSIETVAPAEAKAEASSGDASKDESRVLYRERGTAQYSRIVSLPAEVDPAASQAKVENGVLTLTLAKKVPTGALAIKVS